MCQSIENWRGLNPLAAPCAHRRLTHTGTEYDGSMTYVIMALMGMHTAGWDDVALSGKYQGDINSSCMASMRVEK